jgi:iron complex outermembrane receptor protein
MGLKSIDESFLSKGRAQGIGRKIAETILIAGPLFVATRRISVPLQNRIRFELLRTYVTCGLQTRYERLHSRAVSSVLSKRTGVQARPLQFSLMQRLRRFSGVDLNDLRINKWVLLLAGIALLPSPHWVGAQKILDLTQKSLEDLMAIRVTSVSKKEQKTSQAAAAVFVITREDIGHSGALSIPDLLRMVPGLDVAQIDAGKWAISARGFNGQYSNKLLVLIDGRTVYTPIFAGVFWDSQNVPLGSIERIEVIRGPGAAVWGSNAVNGVINIITLSAVDTQGGSIVADGAQNSIGPETVSFGGTLRRLGAYRISAEGFQINALPTMAGLDGQDDWRLVDGRFRTDTNVSAKDSLTTEGELYRGDAGEIAFTPVSLSPPTNAASPLRDRYSGWNLLARWKRSPSPGSETSLQVYFDRTTRGDSTYGIGLNTFDIDFQHHMVWGARHDIVWGLGYRISRDDIDPTFRISATPQNRNTLLFSAFAQDEIAILPDRLHASLSARLEHNHYTGFDLQPSARLAWTPNIRNSVWGAVSVADRIPARTDTDFRVNFEVLPGPGPLPILVSLFGNPNQKNEQTTALEAGYRTTLASSFSLDSTLFYNRYRDLVSVEPEPMRIELNPAPVHLLIPTSFGNGLYGEAHGIEGFANWKVTSLWTLSPGYTFSSLHLHRFAGSQDLGSAPATEGGTPDHQAQLRSSLDLPWKIQWNASVYFVNRLPAQSIPSYTRLDTGLNWRAGERASLSLVGQNLLRDLHPEYASSYSTVQSGLMRRTVYGKITWSF